MSDASLWTPGRLPGPQLHGLPSPSAPPRPRKGLRLRNPRPQERGGGRWERRPRPARAPPLVATLPLLGGHAPAPPPTPCLEQSRPARSFKAAGGRRRARFAPSDAAEVAASPLRRRGACREGRRDGGSGTRSRPRVRVKRGGSRRRSGSRARAGGAGPRGRPGRDGRLRVGRAEGRRRARPAGRPGPPAGGGRGPGRRGRWLRPLGGRGPSDVARAYGKGRRGRGLR